MGVPIGVVWLAKVGRTGASLTGLTATVKAILRVAVPALAVTIIVAVPDRLGAGTTLTVRFSPLPPKTMLALGTRSVLEELPFSRKGLPSPPALATVKFNSSVGVSSATV